MFLTDPYGLRERHPITGTAKWHHGEDYRAAAFQSVYSPVSGSIFRIGSQPTGPAYVSVHYRVPNGWASVTFRHVAADGVVLGQRIVRGDRIGVVTPKDRWSTGPHVHVETRSIVNGVMREYAYSKTRLASRNFLDEELRDGAV